MEHTILSPKATRTRLGTYLIDLKYKPDHVFCVSKNGEDDFSAVLCNPQLLRDKGIQIPAKPAKAKTESKPKGKK